MKYNLIKIVLACSIVPQVILVQILKLYPEKIELYYSQKLYPFIFNLQQSILNLIPFSIGDLFYSGLVIYLIYCLVRFIREVRLPKWKDLIHIGIFISVLHLVFQLNWGLNYYRTPLKTKLDVKKEYSNDELESVTQYFIVSANNLHNNLSSSDTLAIEMPYTKNEIIEIVYNNYSDLWENSTRIPKAKSSMFSLQLSYMGYAGYLNPFTLEAQVNALLPKVDLPLTIAHEMAHQLGYAAENEASFIGFTNTFKSKNLYIQYATALFALKHCYNDLFKRDPELARKIIKELNPGIFKNFRESSDFWESYKNPFEPYFNASYDTYLKANGQKSGVKTYSQVVAFLVTYFDTIEKNKNLY